LILAKFPNHGYFYQLWSNTFVSLILLDLASCKPNILALGFRKANIFINLIFFHFAYVVYIKSYISGR